jgi:hypothetical protein
MGQGGEAAATLLQWQMRQGLITPSGQDAEVGRGDRRDVDY